MRHKLTAEDAENAENTDPLEDPWRSVSSVVNILCLLAMVLLAGGMQPGTAQAPRRPDVRFLATPQNVVDAMLELAQVTASDVVYDLGSWRRPDSDHRRTTVRRAGSRYRDRSDAGEGFGGERAQGRR